MPKSDLDNATPEHKIDSDDTRFAAAAAAESSCGRQKVMKPPLTKHQHRVQRKHLLHAKLHPHDYQHYPIQDDCSYLVSPKHHTSIFDNYTQPKMIVNTCFGQHLPT
jgi:hypothetical protein